MRVEVSVVRIAPPMNSADDAIKGIDRAMHEVEKGVYGTEVAMNNFEGLMNGIQRAMAFVFHLRHDLFESNRMSNSSTSSRTIPVWSGGFR